MLRITNISKKFSDFALNEISFTAEKGEYVVVLGTSGAGKSMLLEILAGLVKQDKGEIFLDGSDISHKKIQERNIGLVFQDYAVFPHMSVRKNIAFPLKSKNAGREEINSIVERLAGEMKISHLLERNPETLSGGECQRVALARTLALDPAVLLLDEPLSSLDASVRFEMQSMLRKLNQNGQTIIHVTHDFFEAAALAHKIVVIHEGRVIQTGTPKEIFNNPKTKFIANFTGIRNFFSAKRISENIAILDDKLKVVVAGEKAGQYTNAYFRAEDVVLSKNKLESSIANEFEGTISEIVPNVNSVEVIVDAGIKISTIISLQSYEKMSLNTGQKIWVGFKASAIKMV